MRRYASAYPNIQEGMVKKMVQYLVLGLVAVTALIVFINLIKGLIRGFKKTLGSIVPIVA